MTSVAVPLPECRSLTAREAEVDETGLSNNFFCGNRLKFFALSRRVDRGWFHVLVTVVEVWNEVLQKFRIVGISGGSLIVFELILKPLPHFWGDKQRRDRLALVKEKKTDLHIYTRRISTVWLAVILFSSFSVHILRSKGPNPLQVLVVYWLSPLPLKRYISVGGHSLWVKHLEDGLISYEEHISLWIL